VAAAKGSGGGSTGSLKVKGYSEGNNEKDHDQWEPDREGNLVNKEDADMFGLTAGNTPWPSVALLRVLRQPKGGGAGEESPRK
jgi:hypothetical protein